MKEEKVTQEQIKAWKDQYIFVYRAIIDGTEYYFRPLSRDDYIAISEKQQADGTIDYEFETVKTCLLNKMDEVALRAKSGVIVGLSERIMLKSGFQQVEEEEL